MYNKIFTYIALNSIFRIALIVISISFAADVTSASHSRNMLAYADLAEADKPKKTESSGGGYGLSLMDKNKDAKVSKEEFLKYNEAIFDKVDANGDGSVDKTEADNYMSKRKPKPVPGH
ncbi:MAG: hypothetical protein CMH70_02850 [Nitrosomonadaceae bacterium]|nr:hypothetical protein [Nitrosomonadaceae bacterium]|tara:strand:+ start:2112 stop:2468 length:357 start_codon:yes stop_codon:yes gene_type:complete